MFFYHYPQTENGGYFDGPEHIVIEAATAFHADQIAREYGVYFDGVARRMDCDCCGDRWLPATEKERQGFPHLYGEPIDLLEDVIIVWHDGTITEVEVTNA